MSYLIRPGFLGLLKVVYAFDGIVKFNLVYVRCSYSKGGKYSLFRREQWTRIVYLNSENIDFNKNFRRDLKKLNARGVEFKEMQDLDFKRYFKSYKIFLANKGFERRELKELWFERMLSQSIVLSAFDNGVEKYTIVLLKNGAVARYQYGWSWGEETIPYAKGLHEMAIKVLKRRGFRIYDLGGLDMNNTGRNRIKRSISGEDIRTWNYFKLC